MTAGEGGLVGLTVFCDRESLMVQGTGEASVPMEVDSAAGLPLSGDLEGQVAAQTEGEDGCLSGRP